MKKIILPFIAIVAIGCGNDVSVETADVVERTVEEINAERGDPCDCINDKIDAVDIFLVEIKDGKYSSSDALNKALETTMDGCIAPVGHREADISWSESLKGCETYGSIIEAMVTIQEAVNEMKTIEQNEFVEGVDDGATEVLDKLRESAH